jgi:hypothetical protein
MLIHRQIEVWLSFSASDKIRSQWGSESLVEIEGHDGFRQLIEVSSQDVGSVVDSVASPIEALAISIGRVEGCLEVFDALG